MAAAVTLEEVSVLALLRPESTPAPRVVLVGGVPGAGKTTAITQVSAATPSVDALDPETFRAGLSRVLPEGAAYPAYRPMVHTLHALRVLLMLLRGPLPGRTLVVHDPATRPRRRRWFARLARLRGWDPVLIYVDVPRALAEKGQVLRGRLVDPVSFAGHWARWEALRAEVTGAADELDGARWSEVVLTDRVGAAAALRQAAAGSCTSAARDVPQVLLS
jgi:predicted kinase